MFRLVAAFAITYGVGMNYRERLYVAIAWLPKATVQAAIGAVALDTAITPEDIERGHLVLTIAVLSIILTAPLGAIAIDYLAPKMLTFIDNDESDYEGKDEVEVDNDIGKDNKK